MSYRKHNVFVYGSLKSGFHNNYYLDGSEYVGEFRTREKHTMISFGSYPAVLDDEGENKISGEVYRVDDAGLKALDFLEGNGDFYQRELVSVERFPEKVWMYFLIGNGDKYNLRGNRGVKSAGGTTKWVQK